MSLIPCALSHCMVAVSRGPEAEAVVMFCGEYDAAHTGLPGYVDPLAAVKGCGCKDLLGFIASTPFGTSEGVGTKMTEHIDFHTLPLDLLRRRCGSEGSGRRGGAGGKEGQGARSGEEDVWKRLRHDTGKSRRVLGGN